MRKMLLASVAAVAVLGCGGTERSGQSATRGPAADAVERPAGSTAKADGDLQLTMMNVEEVVWPAQEPDTPDTMRIAVIEGVFPFGGQKAFTALIEFRPGVEVPPHSHPTTERIAILRGELQFGTGAAAERSKAKALGPGAVMLVPPEQPHWGFIGTSTVLLYIHGVGPHNDPRAVDPAAAPPPPPRYDPTLAAPVVENLAETTFAPAPAPAPAGLPPGIEVAVIEGKPFEDAAEYTLHLKLPAGIRLAGHTHPTHERMVLLSGTVMVSAANAAKEMRPGGVVLMPAGQEHEITAKSDAVVQIQGIGPLRFDRTRP